MTDLLNLANATDDRGLPVSTRPELPAAYHQRPIAEILDWHWKREQPPALQWRPQCA